MSQHHLYIHMLCTNYISTHTIPSLGPSFPPTGTFSPRRTVLYQRWIVHSTHTVAQEDSSTPELCNSARTHTQTCTQDDTLDKAEYELGTSDRNYCQKPGRIFRPSAAAPDVHGNACFWPEFQAVISRTPAPSRDRMDGWMDAPPAMDKFPCRPVGYTTQSTTIL